MGNKVAIVTGGSSGIGRCTATALAQSGCVVYDLSRRDIPLKGVKHLNADVTDETSVFAAINQILREQGKIDIANIALRTHAQSFYTLGMGYKCLRVLCKLLPCRLRNWIVGLLYNQ